MLVKWGVFSWGVCVADSSPWTNTPSVNHMGHYSLQSFPTEWVYYSFPTAKEDIGNIIPT